MKKFFALLCLILSLDLTVLAFDDMNTVGETAGHVVSFDGQEIHVVGEAITSAGYADVIICIKNSPPVYDLLTGFEISPSTIYEGMCIRAAYLPSGLFGKPSEAITVWANWDFDDSAVFSVVVSENIQYGNGYCVFLSQDGKYRITVTYETSLTCPYFGTITPRDILPYQEFFVWVDMITASSPALVYPDKMVMLPH